MNSDMIIHVKKFVILMCIDSHMIIHINVFDILMCIDAHMIINKKKLLSH